MMAAAEELKKEEPSLNRHRLLIKLLGSFSQSKHQPASPDDLVMMKPESFKGFTVQMHGPDVYVIS